jgi:hypothetical protein
MNKADIKFPITIEPMVKPQYIEKKKPLFRSFAQLFINVAAAT